MKSVSHIVILTPGFPADENDGNCLPILQNYVRYLKRKCPEISISVITFQYPFQKSVYNWNDVDVYAIAGKNKTGFLKLFTWLKVARLILTLSRKNKINVMHAFWLAECSYVAQVTRFMHHAKVIATILGQDCLPSNNYLKRLNFESMTVVASSEFAANAFLKSTGKAVKNIIPIGLDTESFKYEINQQPKFDVLATGHLNAVKNYSLFIDVIAEVVKTHPEIKTIIAGGGAEFESLKNKIEKLNLQKNINLAGEMHRNDVIELMHNSRLFLHTSKHEGQGYVFAEALYAGMSVVAFPVGNLTKSENIFLCSDKNELVETICKLMKNNPQRKRILMKSVDESIADYLKIYELD